MGDRSTIIDLDRVIKFLKPESTLTKVSDLDLGSYSPFPDARFPRWPAALRDGEHAGTYLAVLRNRPEPILGWPGEILAQRAGSLGSPEMTSLPGSYRSLSAPRCLWKFFIHHSPPAILTAMFKQHASRTCFHALGASRLPRRRL